MRTIPIEMFTARPFKLELICYRTTAEGIASWVLHAFTSTVETGVRWLDQCSQNKFQIDYISGFLPVHLSNVTSAGWFSWSSWQQRAWQDAAYISRSGIVCYYNYWGLYLNIWIFIVSTVKSDEIPGDSDCPVGLRKTNSARRFLICGKPSTARRCRMKYLIGVIIHMKVVIDIGVECALFRSSLEKFFW